MSFNKEKVKAYLQQGDFESLFIEELGWDNATTNQTITIDNNNIELQAVAEKCGLRAFICNFHKDGDIPNYSTRLKIDKQLAKQVNQHLIIFTSPDGNQQYWQWMRQETGKSAALRGQGYHKEQNTGESLLQKLQKLYISLEDEGNFLTIADIGGKVQSAFDEEKLTKKFYDEFKKKHDNFLKFIEGIPDEDLRWYASVIINRLMFIYFLQQKGFLDNNPNYLHDKLQYIKNNHGGGYYKKFLCPLFFEGFAKKEKDRFAEEEKDQREKFIKLLGKIPYLNGGLFVKRKIEDDDNGDNIINIKDEAFENIFNFFSQYHWHLDERPLKEDNEINPDVLGYIFEKYINQKEMGAYYTQEDITGYMSKNSLIPWLFNSVVENCKNVFTPDSDLWILLKDDPNRYIYAPVRYGTGKALPREIIEGVENRSKREAWNYPSGSSNCGLSSETWRETIARRKHYEEIKDKISKGEIYTIEDLITYNLDIKQFARDAIQLTNNEEFVLNFWKSLKKIKILDPACGSGAFLFSALNILEELYETCLDKMQNMIDEIQPSNDHQNNKVLSEFEEILDEIKKHPNRDYFIYKTIIVNNLYGVDIMEEGVEICKLRLFLKLAAQLESPDKIEPLPDIDFNIKHGNSLVGYATYEDFKNSNEGKLDIDNLEELENEIEPLDESFDKFRMKQLRSPESINKNDKHEIEKILLKLEERLDPYLAKNYGVSIDNEEQYKIWKKNHKPFHWWLEFHDIINAGGFHVIIGNPPYLEKRKVDYDILNLQTKNTNAIHAMVIEKSTKILHSKGNISMIVPLALISTKRMKIVQDILEDKRSIWYSNYAIRPAQLFDKVGCRLTIFISISNRETKSYSTHYQLWYSEYRNFLIENLNFVEIGRSRNTFWIPKIGTSIEKSILGKLLSEKNTIESYIGRSDHQIFYRNLGQGYWVVISDFYPKFISDGTASDSSTISVLSVTEKQMIYPLIGALSSSLFWLWYSSTSDAYHLTKSDIAKFPLPNSVVKDDILAKLGKNYAIELDKNSEVKTVGKVETQSFEIKKSKHIIDEIDKVLAKHYGFTDEELDFIINYDIKFRMGLLKKNNQ